MAVRILIGDCREQLKTLPDESVHCCVCSPPYWGLRSYIADGDPLKPFEIGLEPDFTSYIATMVEVFRDVRRVLRKDGVLFLNLGDSYFGGGRGGGGSFATERRAWRDVPCGTSDRAQSGLPRSGHALKNLCGGCRAALMDADILHSARSRVYERTVSPYSSSHEHMESSPYRPPTLGSMGQEDHNSTATEHQQPSLVPIGSSLFGAQVSNILQSAPQPPVGCLHCDNCGACLSVLDSSSRDGSLCVRRVGDHGSGDTVQSAPPLNDHSGNGLSSSAWRSCTIPYLKPKDLCGIPWRVAFALQAGGWWLRQDIIWSKPNPMPESIKDRCTKAHEYIFLLSKSERYYFDQDAIAEPFSTTHSVKGRGAKDNSDRKDGGRECGYGDGSGRNKRSVWEIATAPFSEAHFATFPPALIEPCIKAGCPLGGTVLDPFGGAGTTGLVADRLQRNAILIELNPEYAAMADRRIRGDAPLMALIGS